MDVTPDPDTAIIIRSTVPEPDCSMCASVDSTKQCSTTYLRISATSSVEFDCPDPQNVFNVEINRGIGMVCVCVSKYHL